MECYWVVGGVLGEVVYEMGVKRSGMEDVIV